MEKGSKSLLRTLFLLPHNKRMRSRMIAVVQFFLIMLLWFSVCRVFSSNEIFLRMSFVSFVKVFISNDNTLFEDNSLFIVFAIN